MARRAGGRVIIGYLDRRRFEQAAPQLLHARPDGLVGEPSVRTVTALKGIADSAIREHIAQWKATKRAGAEVSVRHILDVISLDEIKQLDPILIHEIHALLFAKLPAEAPQLADGDTAQVIASAVKEVLKLKSLDSAQPFQNYGLDSISATILAARLEKRLKREISPKWLIEYPTVETLSRYLMTQDGQLDKRAQ